MTLAYHMCAHDLQPDVIHHARTQKERSQGNGADLLERTAEGGGDQDAMKDVSLTAMMTIDHRRFKHLAAQLIEKSRAHRQ